VTKVYSRHMRALGYCARGTRQFFRRHGLDYLDFVRHGIDASALRNTGDAMALRVVNLAEGNADGR
jgi:hypothetical protein